MINCRLLTGNRLFGKNACQGETSRRLREFPPKENRTPRALLLCHLNRGGGRSCGRSSCLLSPSKLEPSSERTPDEATEHFSCCICLVTCRGRSTISLPSSVGVKAAKSASGSALWTSSVRFILNGYLLPVPYRPQSIPSRRLGSRRAPRPGRHCISLTNSRNKPVPAAL
jgi:hypothetical protein